MSKVFIVARATFRNLVRDKILYNTFFVALFLMVVGYWASLLVFGHQDRVMLHFGLAIQFFAILGIAITSGTRLIHQEMESRTLFLILSKPLSRPAYWIGKFLGLLGLLGLNILLLNLVLIAGVILAGGQINGAFFQAATLLWIEAGWIAALSLSLSLFFTPALSAMVAMTFTFISHNHDQLAYLKDQKALGGSLLSAISFLFPRADHFLLDTRVYYDLPLSNYEWAIRFGDGLIWVFIFILIGNAVFYRKNLS